MAGPVPAIYRRSGVACRPSHTLLRRGPDILVLMHNIVLRGLRIVLHLEYTHDPVGQVAIVVK